jgi:ankyrin repeat protein
MEELLRAGVPATGAVDTPLDFAARVGCVEGVKLLVEYIKPTVRTVKAAAGDVRVLSVIAYRYPELVRRAANAALAEALKRGNSEAAALLLSYGARPDVRDSYRRTPLHLAAQNCLEEVFELLLKRGADPRARDRYGKTPLDYAANC